METPVVTGENRDELGRFAIGSSGNLSGRPKGSISITTAIKSKLSEVPEGSQQSYLEQLIDVIMTKAIKDRDEKMIRNIWSFVDGLPKQKIDVADTSIVVNIVKFEEALTKAYGT